MQPEQERPAATPGERNRPAPHPAARPSTTRCPVGPRAQGVPQVELGTVLESTLASVRQTCNPPPLGLGVTAATSSGAAQLQRALAPGRGRNWPLAAPVTGLRYSYHRLFLPSLGSLSLPGLLWIRWFRNNIPLASLKRRDLCSRRLPGAPARVRTLSGPGRHGHQPAAATATSSAAASPAAAAADRKSVV